MSGDSEGNTATHRLKDTCGEGTVVQHEFSLNLFAFIMNILFTESRSEYSAFPAWLLEIPNWIHSFPNSNILGCN